MHRLGVIEGTLAKAHGVVGGMAAAPALIDFARSLASGVLFTTALPPAVAAGAWAAVRHLKHSHVERDGQRARVAVVRARLNALGLPHKAKDSHIIPVVVGDPVKCRWNSDALIARHGIYIQPLHDPKVSKGTERLRITPSPVHGTDDIDRLVAALGAFRAQCELARRRMAAA